MQRTFNYVGYLIANAIAALALFYSLCFAHVYLNGLVILKELRQAGGRVRTDLTQWYIVALLLLSVELMGLLYLLYHFNKWYLNQPTSQNESKLAVVTTGVIGVLVSVGILYFLFG